MFGMARTKRNLNQIMATLPPQEKKVLDHLIKEGSISNVEAQSVHRIRSVSRRITTLREHGVPISHEDRKDVTGQRYRRYFLA